MKSLSELTAKIRQWNFMGFSLLPSLEIAIIHNQQFNEEIINFLRLLKCQEIFYIEKLEKQQQGTKGIENNKNEQQQNKKQIANTLLQQDKQPNQASESNKLIEQNKTKQQHLAKQPGTSNKSQLCFWQPRLTDSLYAIYIVSNKIQIRVHLVIDQQKQGQINDQSFKKIKKVIQRLKRNKNIIFVNFNSSVHKLDAMSEHIQQFGLSYRSKERQIKADLILKGEQRKQIKNHSKQQVSKTNKILNQLSSIAKKQQTSNNQFNLIVKQKFNQFYQLNPINLSEQILIQIQKKYVNLFGVQINRNYNQMKNIQKMMNSQLKRYDQILSFIDTAHSRNNHKNNYTDFKSQQNNKLQKQRNLTKYALHCLHQTNQYIMTSLMGTFSNIKIQNLKFSYKNRNKHNTQQRNNYYHQRQSNVSTNRRSIHWQTMQIMNQIWDIQGDALMKQIDKMPVSFIKQRYKMLDYQTIGGFMPSSCFQAIFSAPLKNTLNHILQTLQIIQLKIVSSIKQAIQYFFDKTNICYDFSDQQCQEVRQICQKFRKQTQKVLKSQIEFISTSSQDFWSFKQLKSNLYSPQQQVYIEIKYIGKNYIKKVFQSIRQTLPRLIGQNLLKQIVLYFEAQSLNSLTKIINQVPIEIQVRKEELRYLEEIKQKQKRIDKLVYYFSLKTNSETSVKNIHEKLNKNWKRMFKNVTLPQQKQQIKQQSADKKGFLSWALNFIKGKKKKQVRRSSSQQKNDKSLNQLQINPEETLQHKKQNILSQKNWLLIINTQKQIQRQKVQKSSEEGFPQRLRPAIWHYLAKKQMTSKISKIQHLLDQAQLTTAEQKKELEQIYKQIQKDVLRTPPPTLFRQGFLKQSLTRVLRAYAISDKDLRYTQGMNFIVGIILCVLTHHGQKCEYLQQSTKSRTYFQSLQQKCFLIFTYMMQKKGLRKIMFIQRATITDLCIRLQDYIRDRSSVMMDKIQRSGFTIEMIFSGALISALTTSQIEFYVQKRVIDVLLTHQFSLLYKIIGQFVCTAQGLSKNLQNETLYYFLKGKFYNQVFNNIGEQGLNKLFHNL